MAILAVKLSLVMVGELPVLGSWQAAISHDSPSGHLVCFVCVLSPTSTAVRQAWFWLIVVTHQILSNTPTSLPVSKAYLASRNIGVKGRGCQECGRWHLPTHSVHTYLHAPTHMDILMHAYTDPHTDTCSHTPCPGWVRGTFYIIKHLIQERNGLDE